MKFSKQHASLTIVIIGTLLFLYIVTKAYLSSFTHDESFTYLNYPHDSFMQIISFSNWYTNNHILNSLFMKYAEQLFGDSELALRLPNLILLLVYMVYSSLLFRGKSFLLQISMFLLLCTNVLLMDLFGLARGYGMSCGFMLMSLYHFISYLNNHKRIDIYLFHFAALLASLSNFTLVTFYVAILLVYNVQYFISTRMVKGIKFHLFQINKVHYIPLLLVAIVLFEPLRRVLTKSELNFGGKAGFYADTVSQLVSNTLDNVTIPLTIVLVLQVVFTLIVLIPLFIIIRNTLLKKVDFFEEHKELITTNILLVSISIIIIAQHLILNSDYPVGRFSIFLFPLFIVHLGYGVNYFIVTGYRKMSLIVVSGIALISTVSFLNQANLHSSAEWGYDSKTKDMIKVLSVYREKNKDQPNDVRLGANWLFVPTINFYRKTYDLHWLLEADRKEISDTDDYLYIFEDEFNKLDISKYEVIKQYKNPKTFLVKNKSIAKNR